MFCIQCGKKNPVDARFCFACWNAVAEAAASELPRAATADSGFSVISGVAVSVPPRYAGFWIRVAASVIDGLVIAVLAIVVAVMVNVAGGASQASAELALAAYYIVSILASWLYYAISESSARQATLGKRAVGIVVTDLSGGRLSFGRASGRAFGEWLNALTLGIGWLMVAFTEQKRGIHDFVAGTVVVHRDPTRKTGPVVLIILGVVAFIPLLGIVAAIAIPGLLRARIAGNEASAIGSLRAIGAAQEAYARRCSGFAPALPSLNLGGETIAAELAASATVVRSGYQFTISPASGALVLQSSTSGCDGAVTQYVAQAIPVTPGTTGMRFFALTGDGTIYVDDNPTFATARPLE